ncbi:hypothetical protein BCR41DRAFT_390363 [Lobosporangium transversale]|uniref:Grap2 and cyclin-D-interacting-domain-containing protein n=1 Tax=Lobosporangium transversale TaxID=64571 RepID=A0A1Y2G9X8_9FUNG|nr:hypothetical protein BCR41DRAFT_390363 [Lobosporangium transversale]ORY99792.1 hypothetical protein BCR41DRAFT_390363 [Lobosporangium transversale]|eukprot:XP_021876026.1 hypothetical protein BCR41DRAFT_390363 [Lobosporangium transversale]
MTEEAQQKIRGLVDMAMSYVIEPMRLSVPAVPETLDGLVEQLKSNLVLDEKTDSPSSTQDEEPWDGEAFGVRLANLGKLLANDVTKATLACKPPAESKAVIKMVEALGETCFRLAGFVESIPVKVAGQTYKNEIQILANNIFLATAGLMNEFLEVKNEKLLQIQQQNMAFDLKTGGNVKGTGAGAGAGTGTGVGMEKSVSATAAAAAVAAAETAIASLSSEGLADKSSFVKEDGYLVKTGIVWEACQIFEKASRSNRQAVAKKWGDMMSTMEDAIAEVQEMIDTNDDKKDSNDEDDEDDDEDDEDGNDSGDESDDSWGEDEKMTEEEKQLSTRANAMLKLTRLLFKKLQQRCLDVEPSRTIDTSASLSNASPSLLGTDPTTAGSTVTLKQSDLALMWDQLYDRAGGIVALTDEIATSLYSPQDQGSIIEQLKELSRKNQDCILMGRLFVRGQAEHERWLDMCVAQFKKILDTVVQQQT